MFKRFLLSLALLVSFAAPTYAVTPLNSVVTCASGAMVLASTGYSAMVVDVSGTFVATLNFKSAVAAAYNPTPAFPAQGGSTVTSITAPGQYIVPVTGAFMCIDMSAFTSGTANISAFLTTAFFAPPQLDVPTGASTSTFGSVTAPGAGAAIATVSPAAGVYDIVVTVNVGSAAAAAEANNMQLKIGASVVSTLVVPPVANAQPATYTFRRVVVPTSTNITVNAIGAGTATVPYNAQITVTPVT